MNVTEIERFTKINEKANELNELLYPKERVYLNDLIEWASNWMNGVNKSNLIVHDITKYERFIFYNTAKQIIRYYTGTRRFKDIVEKTKFSDIVIGSYILLRRDRDSQPICLERTAVSKIRTMLRMSIYETIKTSIIDEFTKKNESEINNKWNETTFLCIDSKHYTGITRGNTYQACEEHFYFKFKNDKILTISNDRSQIRSYPVSCFKHISE